MNFYFSPHRDATERGGWFTLVHSSFSHSIASYSNAFPGDFCTVFALFGFEIQWSLLDNILVAEFPLNLKVPQDVPEAFDSLDACIYVHPHDNP